MTSKKKNYGIKLMIGAVLIGSAIAAYKLINIVVAGKKLDFYLNGISNVRLDSNNGLRVKFDVAIFLRNKEKTAVKIESLGVTFNLKDKPPFAKLTGKNIEAKANDITRVVLTAQTANLVNVGIQAATALIEMIGGKTIKSLFYTGSLKAYGVAMDFGKQELAL